MNEGNLYSGCYVGFIMVYQNFFSNFYFNAKIV